MKTNLLLADESCSALDLKLAYLPTTNYAGEFAGELFYEAVQSTNTFNNSGIRTFMSVPYAMNLSVLSLTSNPVTQAYTCTFVPGTNIVTTDRVLSPQRFSVQLDVCKSALWQTWFAEYKKQGVENNEPALNMFMGYVQAYLMKRVAGELEQLVWNANTLTGVGIFGLIDGFVQTAITGGASVIPAVPVTSANILSILENIATTLQSAVLEQPDVTIFMNNRMAQYYAIALAAVGGSPFFNNLNGAVNPATYLGQVKIHIIPNLPDNTFVAGHASNFVFGTDMTSLANAVQIVDRMPYAAEDILRFRMDYTAGTQIIVPSQVVVVA